MINPDDFINPETGKFCLKDNTNQSFDNGFWFLCVLVSWWQ